MGTHANRALGPEGKAMRDEIVVLCVVLVGGFLWGVLQWAAVVLTVNALGVV